MRIKLRLATPQDADALLEIYAPYVKQTAISFEYDVPSAAELRSASSKRCKDTPICSLT